MDCPSCGHDNRDGARFCGACATDLSAPIQCSACGTGNPPGQRFCDACANPLSAGAAPPSARPAPASYTPRHLAERILDSRAAIEGERKLVTVLFADIVDSVALGERSDPEEMHALMDRCFRIILPEVHRYEGTINQFQGDGFMALFGAPIALEDAPRRACLAALAIHRAVEPIRREVQERHGADLQWRIGIHSGPVVVGSIGDDLRMDYTAVGDTTNLAARLEKAAPPGGILISETTRRLIEGLFETEDLGMRELKGKSRSTPVHLVTAERELSRMEAGARAGLTPLCGRDHELSTLQSAYESAREGRGQVIFLVGEAGIGKSRLLHEFQERLAEEAHVFFLGLCVSYGRAHFQPVIDGLRRLAGIDDQQDDATASANLDQAVHHLHPSLDWTLPYLKHLLSLPSGDPVVEALEGIALRQETVKALSSVFLAAASERPIVIAIEDLHWIDPTSEAFLASLIDSLPTSRIVLALSYRPGYQQPFGDRSYFTRVAMQALSEGETGEMAGSLLAGARLPAELRRLVARKAEGNPLFIEEVTRSLMEDGSLRVESGSAHLTREIEQISIPDRIHDVLMARIDRLADGPKQAIQIASVIGREFAMRLLRRLVEHGDSAEGVVNELRSLELIYEKSAHPELAFMFKHALTHDVAYQSVLLKRRRTLHGIVGRAIEELYPDRLAEHYEKLAHHFDRAEEWSRALEYRLLSARKAAHGYANQTAIEHCRRALEIAEAMDPQPADQILFELEVLLGSCAFAISEFRPSARALRRAADHAPDAEARARSLAGAAHSATWAHDYDEAEELIESSQRLARENHCVGVESLSLSTTDQLTMIRGEDFGLDVIDRAVELAEEADDAQALVLSLSLQAGRYERGGDFEAAVTTCERALAVANRERLGHMATFATWFLGLAKGCLGQYRDALTWLEGALQSCERIGDQAVRPRLLNTLGWCYAEVDSHERAAEYNRLSTELARTMVEEERVAAAPELYANGAINLAGNRLELGDVDGAERALEPILDQIRSDDDPWMRWRYSLHLLDARARIALARGELDDTLLLTRQEIEGARRSRSRKLLARALELRGRALLTADRLDESEAALNEAAELSDEIRYPPTRWRSSAMLAELARRRSDDTTARFLATRTRSLASQFAQGLPTRELQHGLSSLGERLATAPLAAQR